MIWVAILALTACAIAILLRPFISAQGELATASSSLDVYRNQLREVDSDFERGLITSAEAEAARLEIKRRIIALDATAPAPADARLPKLVWMSGGVMFAGLCIGLYAFLGRPSYPGHPYDLREEQSAVELSAQSQLGAMIEKLTAHLATKPDDLEGWKALGWAHLQAGNTKDAVEALKIAAAKAPDDASVLSMYAEAMVRLANGNVAEDALAVFDRVLSIEGQDPRARYYRGLYLTQHGKEREGLELWIAVIKASPKDAEWLPSIREQARSVALRLKLDPSIVP